VEVFHKVHVVFGHPEPAAGTMPATAQQGIDKTPYQGRTAGMRRKRLSPPGAEPGEIIILSVSGKSGRMGAPHKKWRIRRKARDIGEHKQNIL
jgi:hypothetical protein